MKKPNRMTLTAFCILGFSFMIGFGSGCSRSGNVSPPEPSDVEGYASWFPCGPVLHAPKPMVFHAVHTLVFAPDGHTLISASNLGGIKVWDLRKQDDSACVKHYRSTESRAVALHPDGKTLAVAYGGDPSAYLIDLDSPAGDDRVESHALAYLRGLHTKGDTLAFAANGKALAVLDERGGLAVWAGPFREKAKGTDLQCSWHEYRAGWQWPKPKAIAFSPNGTLLAVTADEVECLDVTGFEVTFTCKGSRGARCVAFSPDGKILASGGALLQLWNGKTGALEKNLPVDGEVSAVAFSPDGKTLASCRMGGDAIIELWDLSDGKVRQTIKETLSMDESYTPALAFSRDGAVLASGDAVGRINFYDVRPKK